MTISSEQMTIVITAIAAVGAYYANRAKTLAEKSSEKLETIRLEINSRMTQTIELAVAKALAEGKIIGAREQKTGVEEPVKIADADVTLPAGQGNTTNSGNKG